MKKILLIMLVMVTVATSGLAALLGTAGGKTNWFEAANYDPVGVPQVNTNVEILCPHGAPAARIDAPGALANSVGLGKWNWPGHLAVGTNGTLAVTAHILMGQEEGVSTSITNNGQITLGSLYCRAVDTFVNNGILTAAGIVLGDGASAETTFSNTGDVSVNGWLHLSNGSSTPVAFNMNGGTVAADYLNMDPGGSARLNLHGGTMTLGGLNLITNGAYTIDVMDGQLIVNGNKTNELNSMVSLGCITTYAGGDILVGYADGKTTLASTFPVIAPKIEGGNMGWVFYGEPAGTFVGSLNMAYPETGETYSYSFDPSLAGNANASFTISGTNLLTAAVLEAGTYPISIIATDSGGEAFTNRAAVVKVKDGIARIEIQQGRFVSPRTGGEFAPTGFNYIKLRNPEPGELAHSNFDPAFYDRAEVEAMFADLETNGFNTVRVFLDPVSPLPAVSLFESSAATGLSPVYMNNVYDFLRRASNHGIYVVIGFSMWGPSASYLKVGGSSPMVSGANNLYFRDGAAETRAALLAEVCSAIKAHDPKLLPVVLAYEPQNELCYFVDQEPLSLTEGIFTYEGQTYDLSSDAQVRNLLDAVSVNWCNSSVQAVQAIDPQALVSINVFTYHAVGRTGPAGPLDESADTRVPARPLALAGSNISYLDIHLYHENMAEDLESIEFEDTRAACTNTGKPLLMGEFGNHSAATAAAAAQMLEQHVANAYGYGFSGFLLWTYDLPGSWWNAKDDHGEIFDALAQSVRDHYSQRIALPNVFSDDMVLQRQAPIPVYGTSTMDSTVTVSLVDASDVVVASTNGVIAGGNWSVRLPALEAGGPYRLMVAGGAGGTNEFSNVMIGEVYILAGQSNMDWVLAQMTNSTELLADCANHDLRIITPTQTSSATPQENYASPDRNGEDVTWKELDAASGFWMSAIGYFFGRELTAELGVTVGIVNTSRGGTYIHEWLPIEVIQDNPNLNYYLTETPPPSEWYNALVAPAVGYGARGILWYQGEGNVWKVEEYKEALSLLMESWRERWDIGSMPFLIFQLPGYGALASTPAVEQWGKFRESQAWAVENNDDAYLVVNVPGGERSEIHPQDKEGVGWRASRTALKNLHGQSIVGSGPSLVSAVRSGGSIVCTFDPGGAPLAALEVNVDGITLPGGTLGGFAVAGIDGVWAVATAAISGTDTVTVSSPSVPSPVHVMYGLENFPLCNLFNTANLPCAPFRVETSSAPGGTGVKLWDDGFDHLNPNWTVLTNAGSVSQTSGRLILDTGVAGAAALAQVSTLTDETGSQTSVAGEAAYNFYAHPLSARFDITSITGTPDGANLRNTFYFSIGDDANGDFNSWTMDNGLSFALEQLHHPDVDRWRLLVTTSVGGTQTVEAIGDLSGLPTAFVYTLDGTHAAIEVEGAAFTVSGWTISDGGAKLSGNASDLSSNLSDYHLAYGAYNLGTVTKKTVVTLDAFEVTVWTDSYTAWALGWGVDIGGATHDYDGDGMNNLMEYALGGNPNQADAAAVLPVFQPLENHFYHIHNERTDDPLLSYTVQLSTNLVSDVWKTNGVEFVGETAFSNVWKTVTNKVPTLGKEQQFIRLKVERE